METVSARLDSEALGEFGNVMKESKSKVISDLVEAGRKHKAVELYKNKKVSLGLASRLAGVTLSELIDLLKEHGVFLNLEVEDVEKAMETARKVI